MQVQGGWLDGNEIRRARKAYKCQYFRGKQNGGVCRKPINPGDLYCEGEADGGNVGRNGILLRDKYCLECAGAEAVATVALVGC